MTTLMHSFPWRALAATIILAGSTAFAQTSGDPLKDIRQKDPAVRERAAKDLAGDPSARAEAALTKAVTRDEDVLVLMAALDSLAVEGRSERATKALVEVALESPFHRVRRRAAEVAATVDAEGARARLGKKLTGKTFGRAAEALTTLLSFAEASPTGKEATALVKRAAKGMSHKDPGVQPLAAGALIALTRGLPEERAKWRRLLITGASENGTDIAATCAALEALTSAPVHGDTQLLELLDQKLPSVIERRLEAALSSVLGKIGASARTAALLPVLKDPIHPRGPRLARIFGAPSFPESARIPRLKKLLETGDLGTQAAAVHQLSFMGAPGAEVALAAVEGAEGAALQLQLVRALEEGGEIVSAKEVAGPGSACRALIQLLQKGEAPRVREAAARALGRPGLDPAVRAELERAVEKDKDRGVRIVANIALGRVRSTDAVPVLLRSAASKDWRIRAAAAEGFKQLSASDSVQPLLDLFRDDHSAVRATARHALLRLSGKEGQEVDPKDWVGWWKKNIKHAKFETLEESKARREKYGYGIDETRIYRGLDVVVIPGAGDHIEGVLERLGVKFRLAQAGQLAEAGLHPGAILLVGCTGEIAPADIEVVRWYVRSGGALFTSCWALTYTLEASFPSILTKSPSPGQVLDNVFARPTAAASRSAYLRGVFDGGVQPYYSLQGAHLISVVDPERAHVLLDSPEAAARHGSGVLAAWFRMGHGVVLNSANHFQEQGFSAATGLKKPGQRQAFALNHMGLSPVQLRAVQGESWWSSTSKAAKEVSDLSVFRILTNFVREKRIRG